jgi:O-antigen/teichoic acid export membrane protein
MGLGAGAPFIGLFVASALVLMREGPWLLKQAKGGQVSRARTKAWMVFGIPVAMAMMLDILLSVSDRFLIDYFLGEAAVGAYAAGYGVADKPVLMICAWAGLSASPILMAAFEEEGEAAASEAARGLFNAILFLGLPAAVGLALVADPLAEAAIAADLAKQAAEIIPFIAFAGLLNGLLIHYVSESFQLVRRTDQRAMLMIVPVVFNIALNLILLPKFGLMGAVYATVASYGFAVLLLGYFGRKLLVLPVPLAEIAKVMLAALAMWPIVHLMPDLAAWPELLLKVMAGGAVYVAVAVLLDAGGARHQIKTILRSRRGVNDA